MAQQIFCQYLPALVSVMSLARLKVDNSHSAELNEPMKYTHEKERLKSLAILDEDFLANWAS